MARESANLLECIARCNVPDGLVGENFSNIVTRSLVASSNCAFYSSSKVVSGVAKSPIQGALTLWIETEEVVRES